MVPRYHFFPFSSFFFSSTLRTPKPFIPTRFQSQVLKCNASRRHGLRLLNRAILRIRSQSYYDPSKFRSQVQRSTGTRLEIVESCDDRDLNNHGMRKRTMLVLGVDRSASQRDIQKAFHKLSLQYHPDKNKNKCAQEKFAEINNAYDILSDEEKKKNYDLYGDEKGNPGFDGGNFGNQEGHSYYTSGGPGSGPGGWQTTGGEGNTKSFFSFGGAPGFASWSPFGFDISDMFSSMFGVGKGGGNQYSGSSGQNSGYASSGKHSGFGGPGGQNSGYASSWSMEDINSQFFSKHIKDQGLTWILLFYTPSAKGYHVLESIIDDVANSLQGAVKAGKINCLNEKTLCKELCVSPSKSSGIYVYSYSRSKTGSLVEYTGDFDARSLKAFCQDHLPRFSKRVDLSQFDFPWRATDNLPRVLLLSTKKDTPVMWRVLSGLYRRRFVFYDAEVHDASHPLLRRSGVETLPAVVGRLANGEELVLRAGISVKDLKSGVGELRTMLESFDNKNRYIVSSQSKKQSHSKGVPYLTASNVDSICGDKTTVCIIGVFRSSKAKEKLEKIISAVSQKTFVRRQNSAHSSGDSISYALLDSGKQSTFLYSFHRSGYRSMDSFLVAYKPRKGKFAVFTDETTMEESEKFVSSVLNGDIRFTAIRQKPVLT